MQETSVGETLPLFEGGSGQRIAAGRAPTVGRNASLPVRKLSGEYRKTKAVLDDDRHMHVAWQLSKALKAVKTGRKTGRDMARLTANQRHQVGNAICEHLLASLRQQVHSEQASSKSPSS